MIYSRLYSYIVYGSELNDVLQLTIIYCFKWFYTKGALPPLICNFVLDHVIRKGHHHHHQGLEVDKKHKLMIYAEVNLIGELKYQDEVQSEINENGDIEMNSGR